MTVLFPGGGLYNFPPPGFRIASGRERVGFEWFFAGASHFGIILELFFMV
jgi:hypothetical protein